MSVQSDTWREAPKSVYDKLSVGTTYQVAGREAKIVAKKVENGRFMILAEVVK